jgi:hypothetical protein
MSNLEITTMSDIAEETVNFLVKPYLPLGKPGGFLVPPCLTLTILIAKVLEKERELWYTV